MNENHLRQTSTKMRSCSNYALEEIPSPEDDDDPTLKYTRSAHVEPFHRQRRIDGSLPFNEQILGMQHILSTNGLDGRCVNNNPNGGIWKEIIHTGIGQTPSPGASV